MLAIMIGCCSLKSETKPRESVNNSQTEFLKDFYLNYVLHAGNKNFGEIADVVCTPKLLKFLADNYTYDCYEDDCYAIWLFRTGVQDGTEENKVISVTALEDNWYRVEYVDMGTLGVTRIHFVEDDGVLKMDEINKE